MATCKNRQHDWKEFKRVEEDGFSYSFQTCQKCGLSKYGGMELQAIFDHAKLNPTNFFLLNDWLPVFIYWEGGSICFNGFKERSMEFIRKFKKAGIHMERPPMLSSSGDLFEKCLKHDLEALAELGLVKISSKLIFQQIIPGKFTRERAKETMKKIPRGAWIFARYGC